MLTSFVPQDARQAKLVTPPAPATPQHFCPDEQFASALQPIAMEPLPQALAEQVWVAVVGPPGPPPPGV